MKQWRLNVKIGLFILIQFFNVVMDLRKEKRSLRNEDILINVVISKLIFGFSVDINVSIVVKKMSPQLCLTLWCMAALPVVSTAWGDLCWLDPTGALCAMAGKCWYVWPEFADGTALTRPHCEEFIRCFKGKSSVQEM